MVKLRTKNILEILNITRDELKILTRNKNGHRIYTPNNFHTSVKVPFYNFGDLFSLCLIHNSKKSQYGNLLTALVPKIQRSFKRKVIPDNNPFEIQSTGEYHWYFNTFEKGGLRGWNILADNGELLFEEVISDNFPFYLWFAKLSVALTKTSQNLQFELVKVLPEYKEQAGVFQIKKENEI